MTDSPLDSSRWLIRFASERDADVRLICFPHAGGGASTYRPWAESLGPTIAVHGVQLPCRENRFREPPVGSLREALDSVVAALSSLDDCPLVLFGHSMGALLAFEVARRLHRADESRPSALLVSGRPAPHLPSRTPRLGHLSATELFHRVAALYRGVPDAVRNDPEMAEVMGRALHADFTILEDYEHDPDQPLTCPILAFSGDDDPWVTESEIEAWRQHSRRDVPVTLFRGDHFYFKAEESRKLLLTRIRDCCLAVARPAGAGRTHG